MVKIHEEKQILDEAFRARAIEEWKSSANQSRKYEAYKRYQCFKEQGFRYVLMFLRYNFEMETLKEMVYALANIPITKKIVDKLSRVYSAGVKRVFEKKEAVEPDPEKEKVDPDLKTLQEFEKLLEINRRMKKGNRYLKLFMNAVLYVKPVEVEQGGIMRNEIKVSVLPPYLFDVIEDPADTEKAMVYVLSDYEPRMTPAYSIQDAIELDPQAPLGQTAPAVSTTGNPSAAVSVDPKEQERWIWWSKNHHFTTDGKGKVVPGLQEPSLANPLLKVPMVDLTQDQDGCYWALGGNSVADGDVLINTLITNVNHIGVSQGYGQMWVKGEDPPTKMKVGPTRVIRLVTKGDGDDPSMGYATANPPIGDLLREIEQYIALLLSTNNLSTSGVSTQLKGGADFPSGIALMIDKSESTEDVADQQQVFLDAEPKLWGLVFDWHKLLSGRNSLSDRFAALKPPKDPKVTLTFGKPQPMETENERLDALAKRQKIGLNTLLELIKMDDPTLSDEKAKERLAGVMAEQALKLKTMMELKQPPEGDDNAGKDFGSDRKPGKDDGQD
jgi:hypothetical protein